MRALRSLLLLGLLLSAFAALAQPLQEVPELHSRVTDLTGTLAPSQLAALEEQLAQLERDTGSQLAVLLVETTAPEDIAAYSIRVVDAWKLGREGVDDGVLFLLVVGDRRMRIEVGYGLEGAIPDARVRRIIDTVVAPRLRQGDFAGGIGAGVEAISALVRGEDLPPAPTGRGESAVDLASLLPVVLIVSLVLGGVLRRTLGTLPGSLTTGAVTGFVAWLIAGVLGVALLVALIAFFICLFGGANPGAWSNRGGYGGGFGGGFGGRGGGFGGGLGGGGFGGGGGGFGGGGASGGW